MFKLAARDLASFDSGRSSWVAEPGRYRIHIGCSSRDIRGESSFKLKNERVVEEVNRALVPEREIEKVVE